MKKLIEEIYYFYFTVLKGKLDIKLCHYLSEQKYLIHHNSATSLKRHLLTLKYIFTMHLASLQIIPT